MDFPRGKHARNLRGRRCVDPEPGLQLVQSQPGEQRADLQPLIGRNLFCQCLDKARKIVERLGNAVDALQSANCRRIGVFDKMKQRQRLLHHGRERSQLQELFPDTVAKRAERNLVSRRLREIPVPAHSRPTTASMQLRRSVGVNGLCK